MFISILVIDKFSEPGKTFFDIQSGCDMRVGGLEVKGGTNDKELDWITGSIMWRMLMQLSAKYVSCFLVRTNKKKMT